MNEVPASRSGDARHTGAADGTGPRSAAETSAPPDGSAPPDRPGHPDGPAPPDLPTYRGDGLDDPPDQPPADARRPSIRPLVGLLTAALLALTGTRVSAIALPWFALVTTGSPALTGLVVFCEMAPYVVAKALSGPVVDRVGTRLASWTTDLASGLVAGLIPLCYLLDMLPFWLLLVWVALLGTVRGPADLAKQVMVPEAADRCAVPLERATGLSGAVERFASTVGPLLGGGLIALIGPVAGLTVNAVCFLLCVLLITMVLPPAMGRRVPDEPATTTADPDHETGGVPETQGAARQPEGYWRQLRGGLTFLLQQRLLLILTLMICATNLLDAAFSAVLLPVWAERNGGPMAIAWVGATMGATAIAGSVIASVMGHRLPRYPVFVLGLLLVGPPRFLILAADTPLWAVLVVVGVGGFGGGFVNPVLGATIFERIPRPILGRVTSLFTSVAWAGIPLGGLLGGLATDWLGLATVLAVGAVLYAGAIVIAALLPATRTMDDGRGRGDHSVPAPPDTRTETSVSPTSGGAERDPDTPADLPTTDRTEHPPTDRTPADRTPAPTASDGTPR